MEDTPELFPALKPSDLNVTRYPLHGLPTAVRGAGLDLVRSVRLFGVWHPIVVLDYEEETTDGPVRRTIVKDGQRRLDAAQQLDHHSIPAIVVSDPSLTDRVVQAVLQLHFTRKPSPAGEYLEVAKMDGSHADIAAKLGITERKVKQYMALRTLHEELHRAFCEERLTWSLAQRATKLGKAQQEYLVRLMNAGKTITGEDLRWAEQAERGVTPQLPLAIVDPPDPYPVKEDHIFIPTDEAEALATFLDSIPLEEAGTEAADFIRTMARKLRGIA